ncbi:unnamed protein product [Cyprideis torosa]|uniref:Uncharacterized protein n=1 Tax=Cyprideis torosa TaxID=163714 RepID=A0A7R8W4K1_9CRUS|nr:unnamed protein product [Cyprideis torosa]CAG0884285.1 unnamed protein product [Cyprideis torosa]
MRMTPNSRHFTSLRNVEVLNSEHLEMERCTYSLPSSIRATKPFVAVNPYHEATRKSSKRSSNSDAASSSNSSTVSWRSAEAFQKVFDRTSLLVQRFLDDIFFWFGSKICRRPLWTILLGFCISAILGCGIVFLERRRDPGIWLPRGSFLEERKEFRAETFPAKFYQQIAVISTEDDQENIFRPDVIEFMQTIDDTVRSIKVGNLSYEDVCARPSTLAPISKLKIRRKRYEDSSPNSPIAVVSTGNVYVRSAGSIFVSGLDLTTSTTERTSNLGRIVSDEDEELEDLIDDFMSQNGGSCIKSSLLSLADDKEGNIFEAIRQALSETSTKKRHSLYNFEDLIAGVTKSAGGKVLKIEATLMVWSLAAPQDRDPHAESVLEMRKWERKYIESLLRLSPPPGIKLNVFMHDSFRDAMDDLMDQNMPFLFAGFGIMFLYVLVNLGTCNSYEQRAYVSLVGLSVVGLAVLSSYGLCAYLGLFFGPIHSVLPFLLLGIGVDDIFVIVKSLENLTTAENKLPVEERIARALKVSGASITITSLTDVLAFGIGATTRVPALSSFCLYAAIGIGLVFLLQLIIFVPFLCLDERRKVERREACCWSQLPADYQPNRCFRRHFMSEFVDFVYAPFVLSRNVKWFIVLTCLGCAGFNAYGVLNLEYNYDPIKYIAAGSYQDNYVKEMKRHFPLNGEEGGFYIGSLDYAQCMNVLLQIPRELRANPTVKPSSVSFWLEDFNNWLKEMDYDLEEEDFQELLREFLLFTSQGRKFLKDMFIEGDLLGDFSVTGSVLPYQHIPLHDGSVKYAAMDSIYELESEISAELAILTHGRGRLIAALCDRYGSWRANAVVAGELFRNLGLTLAAVFCVTLLLIGDFRVSLWVFLCVLLTMVNIGGCMYFWGLPIEILTSIQILVACGLAVDYSVHIGHSFISENGDRNERAHASLVKMGPAVWSGGLSTFLAFVMLSFTDSYVFSAFFKVFFLVVFFGLFHGLCFLPVVLSVLGPSSKPLKLGSYLRETSNVPVIVAAPLDSNETSKKPQENLRHHRYLRVTPRQYQSVPVLTGDAALRCESWYSCESAPYEDTPAELVEDEEEEDNPMFKTPPIPEEREVETNSSR